MTVRMHPQSTSLLQFRGMGSLHVGGELMALSGLPLEQRTLAEGGTPVELNPNGQYAVGHMYAQYYLAAQPCSNTPLMFWHGGGLTGACWETTPDGREGWSNTFARFGWDIFVCDAAERGRAGYAPVPHVWPTPISQTATDVFNRFRFGRAPTNVEVEQLAQYAYPHQQFPIASFSTFIRQLVPRWSHTDTVISNAYSALLAHVPPSAIICHSQGGMFGLSAAIKYPDRVRAVVALEPAAVPLAAIQSMGLQVPVLIVMGDHMTQDARWPLMRERINTFAKQSDLIEILDLPSIGIVGNSHMLMMDLNSDVVAQHVQNWLANKLIA
jgi:pimeloyl-ACP methyl ester carboxylesterase